MTGMGEEIYVAEASDEVDALVESAARWLLVKRHGYEMRPARASLAEARAALESLGIPLEVLAALKAGTWQAVPKEPTTEMWDQLVASWPESAQMRLPPQSAKNFLADWQSLPAAAPITPTGES